jgi:hypothetical protein
VRTFWYQTQERAFAPGIGDGWPPVVKAPHTKNARLVRRDGDPSELLAALKAALPFVAAVYREHGRSYLENSGDLLERIEAAIVKAEPAPDPSSSLVPPQGTR